MPKSDPLRAILDEQSLADDEDVYCFDPGESVRSTRVERPRAPDFRSPTKQDRIAILAEQGCATPTSRELSAAAWRTFASHDSAPASSTRENERL